MSYGRRTTIGIGVQEYLNDQQSMIFPIIVIKPTDASIYLFKSEKEWGIGSVKKGKFYSGILEIYDSVGNVYKLDSVSEFNFDLFVSLRFFQPMYKANISLEYINEISLENLKEHIVEHIFAHKQYWRSLDTIEALKEKVLSMRSFKELYFLFR